MGHFTPGAFPIEANHINLILRRRRVVLGYAHPWLVISLRIFYLELQDGLYMASLGMRDSTR
ncbi:hypothetical protein MK280_06550 [Myxococcota bacterium]|nr:hypothetical protein [Myxococcota bacterium]